jgi:hypothetical protein
MKFSVGKYHALTNPTHLEHVTQVTNISQDLSERSIDCLPDILGHQSTWMLSGGLAVPASVGRFYRIHYDIDIGVFEGDLDTVIETAGRNSYGLFSRRIMTKIPGTDLKVDIYRSVSVSEVKDKHPKNLRLVRLENDQPVHHAHLLDYFDVYPYSVKDGIVRSFEGNICIPEEEDRLGKYTTISGMEIQVRSPAYIRALKEKRGSPKDLLDLALLNAHQEAKTLETQIQI